MAADRNISPFGGSFEDFIYGATCTTRAPSDYEKAHRNGVMSFKKKRLELRYFASTSTQGVVITSNLLIAQGKGHRSIPYTPRCGDVVNRVKVSLGISFEEIGNIVNTSKVNIINLKSGKTEKPRSIEVEKGLYILNNILDVLEEKHGNRKYLIRSFFNNPQPSLGSISPLEYIKRKDKYALNDLLSFVKKVKG